MQNYFAIFPGQGSQSIGMLADLINEPEITSNFKLASDILNLDLLQIAQNGPDNTINLTQVTQPLILTTSFAIWQYIKRVKNIELPKAVAGHSLGEYSALVIAGVIQFEDAVKITHYRGKLMQEAVPLNEGGMGVIIGMQSEQVIDLCSQIEDLGVVEAVNFNSPEQTVISGNVKAVDKCLELAKENKAKMTVKVNISIPSHCSLMDNVGEKLAQYFEEFNWQDAQCPIYQNYNAIASQSLAEIKQNLKYQVNNPVLWYKSIEQMILQNNLTNFIEIGPGKVLTGLNRKINKSLNTFSTYNINEVEKITL